MNDETIEELVLPDDDVSVVVEPTDHQPAILAPQIKICISAFGYTYDVLSSDVAALAQQATARIQKIFSETRMSFIEVGRDLIAVKKALPHGEFTKWIEAEFNMTDKTAQNYMSAAAEFHDKPEIVSVLPPTTVYKLAAKSTPLAVRDAIVAEVTSGKVFTPQEVQRRIVEAKEEARKSREEESQRKAEEDRKRLEVEAWEAREKELRDAGKTDGDVAAELKRWDTAKAKAERKKARRVADTLRRENERQRMRDEHARKDAQHEKNAKRAVEILRKRLGPDFDRFRELMRHTQVWHFKRAIDEDGPSV